MKRKLLLPGRFAKIFGGSGRSKAGPSRIAGRPQPRVINGWHMCILNNVTNPLVLVYVPITRIPKIKGGIRLIPHFWRLLTYF